MTALILMSVLTASAGEVGVSVAAVAREEASGNHTLLFNPELRYQRPLHEWFAVAATWSISSAEVHSAFGTSVISQLIAARAQGRVPLKMARLEFELAPALRLDVASTYAHAALVQRRVLTHFSIVTGGFVATDLGPFTIRFGTEAIFLPSVDIRLSVSALWRLP